MCGIRASERHKGAIRHLVPTGSNILDNPQRVICDRKYYLLGIASARPVGDGPAFILSTYF